MMPCGLRKDDVVKAEKSARNAVKISKLPPLSSSLFEKRDSYKKQKLLHSPARLEVSACRRRGVEKKQSPSAFSHSPLSKGRAILLNL